MHNAAVLEFVARLASETLRLNPKVKPMPPVCWTNIFSANTGREPITGKPKTVNQFTIPYMNTINTNDPLDAGVRRRRLAVWPVARANAPPPAIIDKQPFGTTPDGKAVEIYTLRNAKAPRPAS